MKFIFANFGRNKEDVLEKDDKEHILEEKCGFECAWRRKRNEERNGVFSFPDVVRVSK